MRSSTNLLRALNDFAASPLLKQLEKRCRRLNIFDVLGIGRYELSHSNFLAWLISPSESHDFGPVLLDAVLRDLASAQTVAAQFWDTIGNSRKPTSIEVRREWMNIDLLVLFHDAKCALVIENKIESSEHDDQLVRYHDIVSSHFGDYCQLFVYLTWHGDRASDDRWLAYSYRQLHSLLRLQIEKLAESRPEAVIFLKQYVDLLGRHFMQDSEVEEMCRQIYQQHQGALDLIYECVNADQTRPLEVLGQELRTRSNHWYVIRSNRSMIVVSPTTWLEQLPDWLEEPGRDPRSWVSLWINRAGNDVNLTIYITNDDQKLREKVFNKLAESFQKLGKPQPRLKAKDTAYVYVERLFCVGAEIGIDAESLRNVAKKVVDELERWALHVRLT